MRKIDDEIIILIIFFIMNGILYFLIFGLNPLTVLCSIVGVPITSYLSGIILLGLFSIGENLFKPKIVSWGNGIPENWDNEFKN